MVKSICSKTVDNVKRVNADEIIVGQGSSSGYIEVTGDILLRGDSSARTLWFGDSDTKKFGSVAGDSHFGIQYTVSNAGSFTNDKLTIRSARISNGAIDASSEFVEYETENGSGIARHLTRQAYDKSSRLAAGAVSLTKPLCEYTSTGIAQSLTLAVGTEGQSMVIAYIDEGGGTDTGVLTSPASSGWTSITFATIGDTACLVYTSNGWNILSTFGAMVA